MIKVKSLDKNPIWKEVWNEYYARGQEIVEEHDTLCAHAIAMLCYNIEQSVNYLMEFNQMEDEENN